MFALIIFKNCVTVAHKMLLKIKNDIMSFDKKYHGLDVDLKKGNK